MSENWYRLLFFSLNLILVSFYIDTWRNPNTTSRVLQVRALFEEGTLCIDSYHEKSIDIAKVNGRYYADKAIFPALMVYGIYTVTTKLGITPDHSVDDGDSIFIIGDLVINLAFCGILLLLYDRLRRFDHNIFTATLYSSIPIYASLFFVYASTFYTHVLVSYLLLQALVFIQRDTNYLLSGLLCGAAFMSEYLLLIFPFVWGIQILIRKNLKEVLLFSAGMTPFILSFLFYNYAVTGHPLETLYSHHVYYDMDNSGFSLPQASAFWGLLFSPSKGAFLHMPVLLSLIILIVVKRSRMLQFSFLNPILIPSILYFLFVTAYREWAGGWTFGPRYLAPIMLMVYYAGIEILPKNKLQKILFWVPVSLGIMIAFTSKFTVLYSIPSKFSFPFTQLIIPKLREGIFNDGNIATMMFNTSPQNAALFFLLLFGTSVTLLLILAKNSQAKLSEG